MAMPQSSKSISRSFRPLLTFLLVIGIAGGGLMMYASTEPKLDWAHDGTPDLAQKVQTMIKQRTLSTTITEPELEALVKTALYEERQLADGVMLTGANAALSGDRMTVRTDVLIGGRLRVQLTHQLHLDWEAPDVVATHESSSLKAIPLPTAWFPIGVLRVPIRFDERVPAEVKQVTFEENALVLKLRLLNPFK
jgi:hypothetical protein